MDPKQNRIFRRQLKWFACASLCLSVLLLSGCDYLQQTIGLGEVIEFELGRSDEDLPNLPCTIGAHRGASVEHLENSFPALLAANEDPRYAFVEFDVQYTQDGQIVVFHDKRLLRVFGSFASVGNSTYAELMEKSDGQISLYRDVMDGIDKKLNIEIKSQGDDVEDQQLADEIIVDLQQRGRLKDVMISSISSEVIQYIKETHPKIPTGQIFWITSSTYLPFDSLTERLYRKFSESKADYLMLHVANFRNMEDLMALKPKGKTIMFWDFDDRMYLVRQNLGDRLWGTTVVGNIWRNILFHLI